ncbi:MAG: hypothetical protein KDA45_06310 [Planctomycetales bacterium]|nr:hypothetical protein [Planctomycetales bacterium]
MELNTTLWLATAALASLLLIQLMDKRQKQLFALLRNYAHAQQEQARKRARVAQLARNSASEKAEQEVAQTRLYAEPDSPPES